MQSKQDTSCCVFPHCTARTEVTTNFEKLTQDAKPSHTYSASAQICIPVRIQSNNIWGNEWKIAASFSPLCSCRMLNQSSVRAVCAPIRVLFNTSTFKFNFQADWVQIRLSCVCYAHNLFLKWVRRKVMGDILFSVFIPHEKAASPLDEESDTAAKQKMLAFLRLCKARMHRRRRGWWCRHSYPWRLPSQRPLTVTAF